MSSGKFVLRTGEQLHARLKAYAARRRLSLNAACLELLQHALGFDPRTPELPYGLERLLSAECSLAPDIIALILYGSHARGEATSASDVDILAVLHRDKKIVRSLYAELDELTVPPVSIMLAHLPAPAEAFGSLWLEVAQDGKVLFDREQQVTVELSRIRREIAAGRYVRRESHGQGYWVHAE